MKKIINQKRYNTESAGIIWKAEDTTLYRKQTGEFFFCDDKTITPISYEEAESWAKENMPEKDFDIIFGTGGDDFEKKNIIAKVSIRTYNKLRKMQMKQRKDINKIIEELILNAAEDE